MWTEYDWRKLLLWVYHTMSSLNNFFLIDGLGEWKKEKL